jgi:hypothetical protein
MSVSVVNDIVIYTRGDSESWCALTIIQGTENEIATFDALHAATQNPPVVFGDERDEKLAWQEFNKFCCEIAERAGIYEHYCGPGRSFSERPIVRRYGKRFAIRQTGGLDI